MTKAYETYQEQEAKLSTTLQENLTGVRVVKAFARQDYEKDKFEKDNWRKVPARHASCCACTPSSGRSPISVLASRCWPVSSMPAIMVINGEITIGTYLAYVGLVVWLIWPMRNLGRMIVNTSTGLVSYERLMEIVKQEREPLERRHSSSPRGPVKGELDFKNVSFQYSDGEYRCSEKCQSFSVKPGQSVALLGSTGSGKTTLVNLLPRFHEYTDGHILLDGVELKDYPRRYLRQQIGIVEQEPFLFSRSIRENITYGVGRDVPQEEVETAATRSRHPRCDPVLPGWLQHPGR